MYLLGAVKRICNMYMKLCLCMISNLRIKYTHWCGEVGVGKVYDKIKTRQVYFKELTVLQSQKKWFQNIFIIFLNPEGFNVDPCM